MSIPTATRNQIASIAVVLATALGHGILNAADSDTLRDLATNAAPGDVPKYDGKEWKNAHDNVTKVELGPGLQGGATNNTVNLSVVFAGPGSTNAAPRADYVQAVLPPVGAVTAWLKNLPNVPTNLPPGWVECNGQVLVDTNSALNGVTIPNLNGQLGEAQRFLRGASTSGSTGGGAHSHQWYGYGSGGSALGLVYGGAAASSWDAGGNVQRFPNTGSYLPQSQYTTRAETLPNYYEVVWIMRVR